MLRIFPGDILRHVVTRQWMRPNINVSSYQDAFDELLRTDLYVDEGDMMLAIAVSEPFTFVYVASKKVFEWVHFNGQQHVVR